MFDMLEAAINAATVVLFAAVIVLAIGIGLGIAVERHRDTCQESLPTNNTCGRKQHLAIEGGTVICRCPKE